MKIETVVSLVLAAMLGVLYSGVTVAIWGNYVASEFAPLGWLRELFGSGTVLFWVGLYSHDIIVNVLLAAPFAGIFVVFRRLNDWPHVCLAVFLSLVAIYWGAEWSNFDLLAQLPTWWAGLAMQLFSLPIAFIAVRAISRRWSGAPPASEAQGRAAG